RLAPSSRAMEETVLSGRVSRSRAGRICLAVMADGRSIPRALTTPLPEPSSGTSLFRKLDAVAVPTARVFSAPPTQRPAGSRRLTARRKASDGRCCATAECPATRYSSHIESASRRTRGSSISPCPEGHGRARHSGDRWPPTELSNAGGGEASLDAVLAAGGST